MSSLEAAALSCPAGRAPWAPGSAATRACAAGLRGVGRLAAGLRRKASSPGLLYFLHLVPAAVLPSSRPERTSPRSGPGVHQSKDQPNTVVIKYTGKTTFWRKMCFKAT